MLSSVLFQFDHARKNKRMRTKPAISVSRSKPSILLKETVSSTAQPSADNRTAVQEMLNGNSDIMKYDAIARVSFKLSLPGHYEVRYCTTCCHFSFRQ